MSPIRSTISHYHLGAALEAKHDEVGACAAYQVVLDRWGDAKESVTAKATRERFKALRCARSK